MGSRQLLLRKSYSRDGSAIALSQAGARVGMIEHDVHADLDVCFLHHLSPCAPLRPNITVPAPMGFSPRKSLLFSAFASLVVFSACDQHHVGELPEVQREHNYPEAHGAAEPVSTGIASIPVPTMPRLNSRKANGPAIGRSASKPTPADFFPETKPQ